MKITLEYNVTGGQIANLMVTCFEGGANYWLNGVHEYVIYRPGPKTEPWYADPQTWENSFTIVFEGEEDGESWPFDNNSLQDGLKLLAEMRPSIFHRLFVDEDYDADDADVALQIILLGDIIYG